MATSGDPSAASNTFNFLNNTSHLSSHERDIFNSIVDRLPDHELFLLLQERRRWNPRDSTSTNSVSTARSSTLSFESAPSLRRSSISSKRESLMSLDDFNIDEQIPTPNPEIATATATATANAQERNNPDQTSFNEAKGIPPATSSSKAATGTQSRKKSKQFFCTYCPADSRPGFVRRSDWKKHETFDHESGKLFICAHSKDAHEPCRKWWYSAKSVQNHHMEIHQRQGCTHRCSTVRESRKSVYACGFRGCEDVFVDDASHRKDAWNERCRHVADHFERPGADINDWDYSTMFVNLLRQPGLSSLWASVFAECDRARGVFTPPAYRWDPSVTEDMRAKLETASYKCSDLDPHQSATRFLRNVHGLAEHVRAETKPVFDLPADPVLFDLHQTSGGDFDYNLLDDGSYDGPLSPDFLIWLNSPTLQQMVPRGSAMIDSPQQYAPLSPLRSGKQRLSSSTSNDAQQVMANVFRGNEDRFYDGT